MNKYFIILTGTIFLGILSASSSLSARGTPPVTTPSAIATGMQWIGKAVDEPDYFVWCTSPILGPDKKVHLFCSRWPKQYGMAGWLTHSEIAHYVGDRPEGPFKFVNIAIPSNPGAPWNNSIHNPCIRQVGDRYVLLYITFEHRKDSPYQLKASSNWTCMAISKSLGGPWEKVGQDGLIVAPSLDPKSWTYGSRSISNPTFIAKDGKYYVYFNTDIGKEGAKKANDAYGYAVADNLTGPYRISDGPCTNAHGYFEDATAFVWNNKCCLLMDDNKGAATGVWGQGLLYQSDVPTDFKLQDAEVGFFLLKKYYDFDPRKIRYYGGHVVPPKFERPGILMINGQPAYFYGASYTNVYGEDRTCSYVLKINLPASVTGSPPSAAP